MTPSRRIPRIVPGFFMAKLGQKRPEAADQKRI
jgi:hypothetical protein